MEAFFNRNLITARNISLMTNADIVDKIQRLISSNGLNDFGFLFSACDFHIVYENVKPIGVLDNSKQTRIWYSSLMFDEMKKSSDIALVSSEFKNHILLEFTEFDKSFFYTTSGVFYTNGTEKKFSFFPKINGDIIP